MSFGVIVKGPEGIVLAADSRLTLYNTPPNQNMVIPATYDNATKLLHPLTQERVGIVTYGLGVLGQQTSYRTPSSLLPELDEELSKAKKTDMPVEKFASEFSDFFMGRWNEVMPKDYRGQDIRFFIAGYDKGQPYGRVFWLSIPFKPNPEEIFKDTFGIVHDGQKDFADRLIRGYEDKLIPLVKDFLKLNDQDAGNLSEYLSANLNIQIPVQFLPLQDCVDISIFLVRTTMMMQTWVPMIRGVGGNVDVATITSGGFREVQMKQITGEIQSASRLENTNIGGKK